MNDKGMEFIAQGAVAVWAKTPMVSSSDPSWMLDIMFHAAVSPGCGEISSLSLTRVRQSRSSGVSGVK